MKNIIQKFFYITIITALAIFFNTACAFENHDLTDQEVCTTDDSKKKNQPDYKTILNDLHIMVTDTSTDNKIKLNEMHHLVEKILIHYINSGHETIDSRIATENQENLINAFQKTRGEKPNIDGLITALEAVLSNIESIEKHDELEEKNNALLVTNRASLMERYSKYCDPSIGNDEHFDKFKDSWIQVISATRLI